MTPLSSRPAAFRWVAGGLVTETAFTAVLCILAMPLGWQSVAFWAVVISLSMYLINVMLMDVPCALIYRHAFGDTSGLWEIAKLAASVLTILMLTIRLLLVWYVTQ